jgi:hypothetical protein
MRKLILSISIVITASIMLVAFHANAAGDLTPKEARKIIARMAGIELPSDAVRVKDVSSFGNSYVVTAQVETAFRFVKDDKDRWKIAEIRTGDRKWEDVDMLVKALNAEKTSRVHAELETIATALESYKREHGVYVEAKTEAALVDHLNPRYLARIMRLDPWHRPYEYQGTRTSFSLRSVGPDGKLDTPDDIAIVR